MKRESFLPPSMKTARNIIITLVILGAIVGLVICLQQKLNVGDQIKKGFTFIGNEFSNFGQSPFAIITTITGVGVLGLGLIRLHDIYKVNNDNKNVRTDSRAPTDSIDDDSDSDIVIVPRLVHGIITFVDILLKILN